jgi:hypothetical protein
MNTFRQPKLAPPIKKFDAAKNISIRFRFSKKRSLERFLLWVTAYKVIIVENPELRHSYCLLSDKHKLQMPPTYLLLQVK